MTGSTIRASIVMQRLPRLRRRRAFARLYDELLARARVHLEGEQMTLDESIAVLSSELDRDRGRLFARMQERRTAIDNEIKFFGLEWTTVSGDEANQRLAAPAVADRAHFLAAMRRFGPHQLPEGEERILVARG